MTSSQPVRHPLELSEIRSQVFTCLSLKDLASCALVASSWAIDTRRFLWAVVGGSRGGLDWDRCSLPSDKVFKNRVQLIRLLSVNKKNLLLLRKLVACGSCLFNLETLWTKGLSGIDDIEQLIGLTKIVGPSLGFLQMSCSMRWDAFVDLLRSLARTATGLKSMNLEGTAIKTLPPNDGTELFSQDSRLRFLSLTHLHLCDIRTQSPKTQPELIQLISCCPKLVQLGITISYSDLAKALTVALKSIKAMEMVYLQLPTAIKDSTMATLLKSVSPTSLAVFAFDTSDFGIKSLNALTRFTVLETLAFGCNASLPAQGIVTVLSNCASLKTLSTDSTLESDLLAVGPQWVCSNLQHFEVSIEGESRPMSNDELMQGGVPQNEREAGPRGTHWMLYYRLSLLTNLSTVLVRLKRMTNGHHMYGFGFHQLCSLKNIVRLYVPKLGATLSCVEVMKMIESWPKLRILELGRCGDQTGATKLLQMINPKWNSVTFA